MHTYAHIELPSSIQALLDDEREATETVQGERLTAIGQMFAAQRQEDVDARSTSGVEAIWLGGEEAYAGIDDSNRHEALGSRWYKPTSPDGVVTTSSQATGETRSNAFVLLTARYVDAGAAKVCDILLPQDDKPFSFAPTPVPDLVMASEDERQLVQNGIPLQRDPTPAEAQALAGQQPQTNELAPTADPAQPVPTPPGQGPGVPLKVKDLAAEKLEKATKAATKAQQRILDWFVEGGYSREMRMVVHDAARIGVGILKGPFPKLKTAMAVKRITQPDGSEAIALEQVSKLVPCFEHKDPWNIFPDKNCGEDIQNGDHLFERDLFSPSQLRALAKEPGYLPDQIDAALKEGPGKKYAEGRNPNLSDKDERFEVWFRYGQIPREDMEVIDALTPKRKGRKPLALDQKKQDVYAIITMVNDRVIKAVLNPLDSGALPYHAKPWRRRAGSWSGISVSEQVSLAQRGVNGAVRALIDNAGLSAGLQFVIDQEAIEPADRKWQVGRNKFWIKKAGASVDDVRKAFTTIAIPSLQPQLEAVFNIFQRIAEDSTSIPLISQGQSGATSPDTLGQSQLQDNNANQLLRDHAHDFDDKIKKPVVTLSYEYHLLDPDVPNDEKGDYQIHISSSVAMVEQAIHDQFLLQIFPSVTTAMNPYKIDPAKLFAQVSKTKKLNPAEIQYSDEEWEKVSSQPPPKAPAVQVAEINAQATLQKAKLDTDRDAVYVQAETNRTESEHDARMAELQLRERLAMLDYANKNQINLDQLKAELASVTMKLQTQKQLSVASMQVDLHKDKTGKEIDVHKYKTGQAITPPTEPAGRAADGQSFQQ